MRPILACAELAMIRGDDLIPWRRGLPRKRRKGIYILPNLFTLAALFGGFYSIVMAMNSRFDLAAMGVGAAMILDSLDGRVARMTNTQSAFGEQMDSLSDMAVCIRRQRCKLAAPDRLRTGRSRKPGPLRPGLPPSSMLRVRLLAGADSTSAAWSIGAGSRGLSQCCGGNGDALVCRIHLADRQRVREAAAATLLVPTYPSTRSLGSRSPSRSMQA